MNTKLILLFIVSLLITNISLAQTTEKRLTFGEVAAYFDAKRKLMQNDLSQTAQQTWDNNFIDKLEELDFAGLTQRINKDALKHPAFFKLYPKKLPTSGYNAISKGNLAEYSFANVAGQDEEPPTGSETSKFLNFYKAYCFFRGELQKGKNDVIRNIRKAINETENEHLRNKYGVAKLMLRRAKMAHALLPDDLRLEELKDEAEKVYQATIAGFGKMITGDFHKTYLEQMVVFKSKPSIGKENPNAVIKTIIPGQPAYIVGYFSATNKDAGGLPSLLLINPENPKAKKKSPFPPGAAYVFTKQPMYNGEHIKDEFLNQAYFSFNLFPDINTINYSSHVEYFPLLNLIKWLRYQPSEVINVPIRYGLSKQMAVGSIQIDLSGDNKQKLTDYYKKLEAKRMSSVTFPDMSGCTEAKDKMINYNDLSKYGKILKTTLAKGGDIMKPWPKDDEIDYNTAQGFAAVEKASGKIEIIPLEFRKKPTDSKWQWWSIGSIPGLYPMQDEATQINAVKKLEHGYQIEKANLNKCSKWY